MLSRLLPLALLMAFACGVKAPPQPPGVPPARRGEPLRLCPGCELPAPDAYPSPSTEGETTREQEEAAESGEETPDEPATPEEEAPEGPSPEGPEAP